MVKLIKSLKLHLRPHGSSNFLVISKGDDASYNSNSDAISAYSSSNKVNLSSGGDSFSSRMKSNLNHSFAESSHSQQIDHCGWDGSSVVLVGFKHYQPAIDDPLYVAVGHENDNKYHHDSTFKLSVNSSGATSPNFEVASLAGISNSREERVNSCDSSDSAVASCILAYNEDSPVFAAGNNSSNSIDQEQPNCNNLYSSPSSQKYHNLSTLENSFLNQTLHSFPEAIGNTFAPAESQHFRMDMNERFERSTTARRYQGGDLKRRTSSIQPFPSAFRVLLESGETRSFRYDNDTTVNDILGQLQEKLGISVVQHFGFVLRRANEIVFVLPETMKISEFVDWCAANEYECSLRVVFPPKQPEDFLLVDPVAFDYLYTQCTNDVLAGRFETELGVDKAIYLSALHILQFAIASNLSGKLSIRRIDKEFGLERFIPAWVRERGRGRTVEHAVSESLRHLTERQRGAGQQNYKMQYVKLLSLMADYGAHAFPAVLLGFTEEKCSLMLGPNCGISYLPASLTQTKPVFLIRFEHIRCIGLQWSGQTPTNITCSVHHVIKDITPIQFLLPRWLKDSFLFVIRRYRRLLVSNNSDVTVIESSGEASTTLNSLAAGSAPSISGLPATLSSSSQHQSAFTTNSQPVTDLPADRSQLPASNNSDTNQRVFGGQRSLNLRHNTKQPRQALLQLNIGQSAPVANHQMPADASGNEPNHQTNLLLTESTSCPNICEMAAVATESGIGSEMDSPRSHPPLLASPPSSDDNGQADFLLEMRFDPPPGFGDSEQEDDSKLVVDNPLCFEGKSSPECPPPPPRRHRRTTPTSPPESSNGSRSHSIDDIVISFNMALKGTLGYEEEIYQKVQQQAWSPICEVSNVVTLTLTDDMPLPPPPELNETSTTLDSLLYPPSECAPPPPPPYPFPLPMYDDSNAPVSSDSGTDEIAPEQQTSMSPLPAPVLLAINSLPSEQLRTTIARVFANRRDASTRGNDSVDAQMACTMADSSALRFSLSVFGAQDFFTAEGQIADEPILLNLSLLDELAEKLVNNCRAVLSSVGHSKTALLNSAAESVVAFAEAANFVLDLHQQVKATCYAFRIGQLSNSLTHALDAYNCCLQTGLTVIDELVLTCSPGDANANEKLRQLLLNAAWLARSLAVFSSLAIQMKQEAAAGDALKPDRSNDGHDTTISSL